jgi:hypothetical protein
MSKRADGKIQIKVKYLEVNLLWIFLLAPVSLVKEWHQMTAIPMIKKASTI